MYCHFCGKENSDDHAFCIYCGTTLEPLDMPVKKKRAPAPVSEEEIPAGDEQVYVPEPALKPVPAPKKSSSKKKKKKKSKIPAGLFAVIAVMLLVLIIEVIILLIIPSRPTHGANLNGTAQSQGGTRPVIVIDDTSRNEAASNAPAPTVAPSVTPAPTAAPAPAVTPSPVPTPAPTPVPASRTPAISAANLTLPDVHNQGSSFSLGGRISCDCGIITNITATVYDAGRNVIMTLSDKPNKTEYQLFNSYIDYNMTFGKLAAGNYTIEITVTARNGDAEAISTVAARSFTVQSPYSGISTDSNGVTIIG